MVCSCNHCYNVKAINVTYFECVFLTLGIQHAMRLRRVLICGLPLSNHIFPLYLMNGTFSKKNIN